MPEEPIRVGFNAARMCEAIARIGYEPHTAILDLVDNAVTAEATEVKISLHLLAGKTLRSRNSVRLYQIVDNGKGMNEQGVQSAFELGAESAYGAQSLSKYGLGLKSAGLSLGSRISIVSKQGGKFTKRYTFDREVIAKLGEFVITPEDLSDEQHLALDKLLPGETGTVVEIEGSESVNHPSPWSTVDKLRKQVGVVYFSYLTRTVTPLTIAIRACPDGKDEKFELVAARDMLYKSIPQFKEHYRPDQYDYASPYLVLNDPWQLMSVEGDELPPITVQAVVFPTNSMAGATSPLTKEEKNLVTSYEITEDNKGFFIYRNGRLIRWGDDLGMIGKDDRNLRIRMDIQTEHDDVLHVDVSKQRLEIDDESMRKLKVIIGKALSTSRSVMEDCKTKLKKAGNNEGSVFTETVRNVTEDDPEEAAGGAATEETQKRRRKRAEEGAKVVEEVKAEEEAKQGAEPAISSDSQLDVFKKVIYTGKVPYMHVWKPQFDATEGVFVCISNMHPFYQEVLSRMPEGSTERVCLEAVIFAVALGESNVRDNFEEITPEILDKIFGKFHKNIGSWLNDWTAENTNFLERND
jgi:hypothetical protein